MKAATPITKTQSKRTLTGVVVSLKMAKTVVVAVTRLKMHPKYKKQYKVTKKFKAHNENTPLALGDRVTIVETKPISKDKHWIVLGNK